MRLEDQVCSLELAKCLKELGVKQESAFYWKQFEIGGEFDWTLTDKNSLNAWNNQYGTISAFTVAELGEMLPEGFRSGKLSGKFLCMVSNDKGYLESTVRLKEFDIKTEADARAKMLIHLLETKVIVPAPLTSPPTPEAE